MIKIRLNLIAVIMISFFCHSMAIPSNIGEIVANEQKIQLNTETRYSVNADLNVKETSLYRIYIWMFGVGKSDNSFFDYEVLADGLKIGKITPCKGNWQLIGLDEDKPIALKNGTHNIEIRSNDKLTPQVEAIYLTQEKIESGKLSANYDNYLGKAKQIASKHAKTTFEYPKARNSKRNTIKAGIIQNVELPLRYSFYTFRSFDKGNYITLTSTSATPHTIDVEIFGNPPKSIITKEIDESTVDFHNSQNLQTLPPAIIIDPVLSNKPSFNCSSINDQERQGLGWYIPAERPKNSKYYTASGKIRIMQDGLYLIRLRSFDSEDVSTADLNINNTYFYNDVPIAYSEYYFNLPANKKSYTVTASSNNSNVDPMLFVCGADADRLVGYNDDCTKSDKVNFGLLDNSACLTQKYLVETSSIDVSNYSSQNPELTCTLRIAETETMRNSMLKSKQSGISSVSETEIFDYTYTPQILISGNELVIISDKIIKQTTITTVEGYGIMQTVSNDYEVKLHTDELSKGRVYFLYMNAEDGSRHCCKFYLR